MFLLRYFLENSHPLGAIVYETSCGSFFKVVFPLAPTIDCQQLNVKLSDNKVASGLVSS